MTEKYTISSVVTCREGFGKSLINFPQKGANVGF